MMNADPQVTIQCIGVFDSGVGGLTVLRELRHQLPDVALRYVADSGFAPYGGRSPEYITERSLAVAEHLIAQGAAVLVVACNTATVHAIAALRERWPGLPIVGTEPGIKPAVSTSRNGRIGVLATAATIASERYQTLVQQHAQGLQVISQPCPGLVDLIETGELSSPALRTMIERLCAPLLAAQVDTVLLGCTHYPLVQQAFEQALGPGVALLNIETAVAQQAGRLWAAHAEPAVHSAATATISLETSGRPDALSFFVRQALGWRDLQVALLPAHVREQNARTSPQESAG